MLDYLFDQFLNSMDQEGQEKYNAWVVSVGEKVSQIAIDLEDEELIETILNDKTFADQIFPTNNDLLLKMYAQNFDIEKAAYEVLNVIVKNKE